MDALAELAALDAAGMFPARHIGPSEVRYCCDAALDRRGNAG